MVQTLLVANRGEIARRIFRTCRRLGVRTIAVYSDADADAAHVREADHAVRLGPAPAVESYLLKDAVIAAARSGGADAIHPGYGFLAENAAFAEAVIQAGLIWVGPPPDAIRHMGLKDKAKRAMEAAGVPITPGYHGEDQSPAILADAATSVGYPVLIKAAAGGGGKGMRRVETPEDFEAALASAKREASASFGDDRVLVEKWIQNPRHVEVQILADSHGATLHVFERDCSLQRRHQKVIEEAPAPGMTPETRAAMTEAAVKAAEAVSYVGAGTVEFIADGRDGLRPDGFFFMEMNTRLQVEHPVTEAIAGLDLVEWQLRIAAGEALPFTQKDLRIDGHAVEARLYAEDPEAGFLPATGTVSRLRWPEGDVRVDAAVEERDSVSPHYATMIAKAIAHGPTRAFAFAKLAAFLGGTELEGLSTNLGFLVRALRDGDVRSGAVETGLIARKGEDWTAPPARDHRSAALAGVAYALAQAGDRPASPWDAGDGWRLNAARRFDMRFADGTAPLHVEVTCVEDAYEVRVAHETFRVEASFDGETLSGQIEGVAFSLRASVRAEGVTLHADGFAIPWPLFDAFAAAEAEAHGHEGAVVAPMPGKVIAVHTSPGEHVDPGAPLVTLEAMKMEHTLKATAEGQVIAIHVAPGDQTALGDALVDIAPRADD